MPDGGEIMKLKLKIKKKTEPVEIVKEAKYTHFTASLLQFLAGISLTIFSDLEMSTITIIVAAMSILTGGAKLLGYFCNDLYKLAFQFDMAIGIFVAIFGILLFARPGSLVDLLPRVVGLYIVLDGVLKIQTAFDARRFGIRFWSVILGTAILVGAMGFLLALDIMNGHSAEIIFMGATLALDGAENAWVTMATVKARVRKKKAEDKFGQIYDEDKQ